jgi:hypothetical protein
MQVGQLYGRRVKHPQLTVYLDFILKLNPLNITKLNDGKIQIFWRPECKIYILYKIGTKVDHKHTHRFCMKHLLCAKNYKHSNVTKFCALPPDPPNVHSTAHTSGLPPLFLNFW